MPHDISASRTTNLFPEQRSGEHALPPDEPHAPDRGLEEPFESARPVPFDRLLSVAVLTPAQAALLTVQLLDAAHVDGLVDGAQGAEPRVGPVRLTSSGALDVDPSQASRSTPVRKLVRELVHNARRLPAHPRPEQLALLRRLERLADDQPTELGAQARDLEAAMAETLGPRAVTRLSRQLAALVDAFSSVAASVPAPVDSLPDVPSATSATAPATSQRGGATVSSASPQLARSPGRTPPRPSGRPPGRSRAVSHPRRRRRIVTLGLVLAVLVGLSGYALLSNPGGPAASAGRGQHPGGPRGHHRGQQSDPTGKQSQHPPVVPALASRHAGSITGVAVQVLGSCTAAAPCPVKVTVHFRPASTVRPVTWRVGTVPVCTRHITWSSPVTVMAQPGWNTVYASSTVRVPKGHSALTALTTTPSRAQSPPVALTGSRLRC